MKSTTRNPEWLRWLAIAATSLLMCSCRAFPERDGDDLSQLVELLQQPQAPRVLETNDSAASLPVPHNIVDHDIRLVSVVEDYSIEGDGLFSIVVNRDATQIAADGDDSSTNEPATFNNDTEASWPRFGHIEDNNDDAIDFSDLVIEEPSIADLILDEQEEQIAPVRTMRTAQTSPVFQFLPNDNAAPPPNNMPVDNIIDVDTSWLHGADTQLAPIETASPTHDIFQYAPIENAPVESGIVDSGVLGEVPQIDIPVIESPTTGQLVNPTTIHASLAGRQFVNQYKSRNRRVPFTAMNICVTVVIPKSKQTSTPTGTSAGWK